MVELLIVVAIVGILAGLLFPAFLKAHESSRKAYCLSSLTQLGKGFSLYLQDWDDAYPTYRVDPASATEKDGYRHDRFSDCVDLAPRQNCWATLLHSEISSSAVLFCPSDGLTNDRPVTSYEFKPALANGSYAQIVDTAGTAVLWEQWAYHDHRYSEYDVRASMNILFADGHASWRHLADSTSARFGQGPDLHRLIDPSRPPGYRSRDF